ncbi:uncharacterized protein LOC107361813 [Tetranychus urticae]|uniref:F-box domain-containing protein n=1 Tax=Tetranychus urticae TaxID=32264 RepID=T1K8Q4_TETUR|nr:uncharacterized protein LOC107361813 [Tetranychus urticae]
MLINELTDDCLLAIFDYVYNLKDLINCYKVCVKWSYLIAKRTRKVKYLLEDPQQPPDYDHSEDEPEFHPYHYPIDCVYYQGEDSIDATCLNTLFPNLIVFQFIDNIENEVKNADIVSFVINHKSLKGIIDGCLDPLSEYCDKLEMLSCYSVESSKIPNCANIKQLHTGNDSLEDVKKYAFDFPNLELLRTSFRTKGNCDMLGFPVFEKLKILVLFSQFTCNNENIFYGFHFMDSCPNLQSAHISLDSNQFFVDETVKHECLKDLVIDFSKDERINWRDLERLLMKYPNLKHLALRNLRLKDEYSEKLLSILPNLELFEVNECEEDTQDGLSMNYCEEEDYSEMKSNFPQIGFSTKIEKISRGFDFMKHCFLKDNFLLPHFLIPIDY